MAQIHLTAEKAAALGLPTSGKSIELYDVQLISEAQVQSFGSGVAAVIEAPCVECATLREQMIADQATLDAMKTEHERLAARIAELEAQPTPEAPTEKKRGK
jgi:cell division protein FtsB